jgi:hypothetical protein
MFVGHYSVSFLAKSLEKSIPLWVLFLAVQLVDILWAIFIALGIEKVRIIPGFTRSNAIDLYFMPYTHSLPGALGWSVLAVAVFYLLRARKYPRAAVASLLVGVAVFSHWILDLIVHVPDLALYDNSHKVGLGLWNYPEIALPLEFLLLFGGLWLYMRSSVADTAIGRYGMLLFAIVLAGIQLYLFFAPSPPTPDAFALTAIASYFIFAGVAFWLERYRR